MRSQASDAKSFVRGLFDLAARKASGAVAIGGRTLVLWAGDAADLLPSPDDEPYESFLVRSGRLDPVQLAEYERAARSERSSLDAVITRETGIKPEALHSMRRALWLDRLVRAFAVAEQDGWPEPQLEAFAHGAQHKLSVRLVPLVLDALERSAAGRAPTEVGSRLNHRIRWNDDPHTPVMRAWAAFGDTPERPAVATVLARKPAAAPAIAALLLAGAIRLDPPGATYPPPRSSGTGTLPPPPPRLIALPTEVQASDRADPLEALVAARPPRTRLHPGDDDGAIERLAKTELPELPPKTAPLDDPLVEVEQLIAELERVDAPGRERARAFAASAELWQARFASIEEAALAYREAAAADPTDGRLLEQAAAHCHRTGQHELALAYCDAAVEAAGVSIERGSALKLAAHIHRHRDDEPRCVEALCEAAADDPSDARPHELVAGILAERGDALGANSHARLAAAAHQDEAPERAQALLSWGFSLCPADPATAYEYASALDMALHREAAIAALASAADRQPDVDARRRMRLAAAQRAEALDRHDLAVDLLTKAFDVEPHLDLLYTPLDQDLAALGDPYDHAALLDDIATACPPGQRGHWLTRAGEVTLSIPTQREAGLWLLYEAVLTEPTAVAALEALRTYAETPRQLNLLAHALRAAIASRLPDSFEDARPLLEELGALAERRIGNPDLALAAWEQIQRLGDRDAAVSANVERLRGEVAAREARLAAAEAALLRASGPERAACSLALADAMADLPENWPRLITALSAARGSSADVDDRLETLYGLSRDPVALATLLDERIDRARSDESRVRALGRLVAIHAVREDTRAVARACVRWLEVDPNERLAIARLDRAAQRLGDPALLTYALECRVRVADGDAERARATARLARHLDTSGDAPGAVARAIDALAADPGTADAAQLLLERSHLLPPERALELLDVVGSVLGQSRQLLARIADAATKAGRVDGAIDALERWTRLLPTDVHAHRQLMRLLSTTEQYGRFVAAIDAAITGASCPKLMHDVREYSGALVRAGRAADAARLFLRTLDEGGNTDPALTARALELARLGGDAFLVTTAMERHLCACDRAERKEVLFDLARHHRRRGDRAAETRALLRALAVDGKDPELLASLSAAFAAAGDGPRLVAVLELAAESASGPADRAEQLLGLVAASARVAEDPERVDYYTKMLIAEHPEDEALIRRALGALYTLGGARWASERCEAIANQCPAELGAKIYAWIAATAEADDPHAALEIAARGALRFPVEARLLLLVERLTLALSDAGTAMSTYDALIDSSIGPHGRRALHYRAGRWLERASRFEDAMKRYEHAFELAPGAGVAFKAIQRLAEQRGSFAPLARALVRLSDHIDEAQPRIELLRRAARLHIDQLDEPLEGLKLLLRASDLSETFELDDEVELGTETLSDDEAIRREARALFIEQLQIRAERLWDGSHKIRCLIRLARLRRVHQQDAEGALALIERAEAMYRAEELDAPDLLAELRREREHTDEVLRPSVGEAAPPAAHQPPPEPESEPEPAADAEADEPVHHPSHDGIAPPPISNEAELREAAARGDVDAMVELAGLITYDKDRRSQAIDLWCEVLRLAPWRVDALRRLRDATAADASACGRVAAELLAVADPSVPAVEELPARAARWEAGELASMLPQPLPEPIGKLLGMLWDHARGMPRFRRTLGSFGLTERDRVTPQTFGPTTEAYAIAARTLGISEVPVYLSVTTDQPAMVAPLHPPAIVAGRDLIDARSALVFWMARALWLARPAHVLLTCVEEADARALIDAAKAALGPSAGRDVSQIDKELAAELWQILPSREQREAARILEGYGQQIDYAELRREVSSASVIVGLLVSASPATALEAALTEDVAVAGLDLARDHDFAMALRRSSTAAQVVRVAFSAPLLRVVSRGLESAKRSTGSRRQA